MRKLLCQMTCLFFFIFNAVHADNIDTHTPESTQFEKIYLQPDQVAITSDGIFFLQGDYWIMTDAIYNDNFGLFISRAKDEWSLHWKCPKCGHENGAWRRSCANCGYKPRH